MRRLPPLAAVRVFEATARHENFTRAADELGMTQAAVSYQIKLLEDRIGAPLFLRDKRRVTLSATGRRIAPLVTGAFDRLDEAFALVRTGNDAVLTVTCSESFGPGWLAPRIGRFQMTRPDLAVRLQASNALVDFVRDDVDVGVRTGFGEWSGLTSHLLMRSPFSAFASPGYLAAHPPVTTPDDVMQLDLISPDDPWWTIWREAVGGDLPAARRGTIRLDSQFMDGHTAMGGNGVALLNPLFWRAEIDAGRLVQPLDRLVYGWADQWLVYPEHRRNVPKIRAFRDWLLTETADQR